MNEIAMPDTTAIEMKARAALDWARSLVIADDAGCIAAQERVRGLKALDKEVIETFAEAKNLADRAHKAVCAAEARHRDPISEILSLANPKIAAYLELQEKRRHDEEERLRQEARRREEDEKLAEASRAEAEGDREGAKAILEAPTRPPVVVVPQACAKAAGVSMSYRYSALIQNRDDLLLLVKFVAANPRHIGLLQPNQTALNQLAVAEKESFAGHYPGVQLCKTPSMTYRK